MPSHSPIPHWGLRKWVKPSLLPQDTQSKCEKAEVRDFHVPRLTRPCLLTVNKHSVPCKIPIGVG